MKIVRRDDEMLANMLKLGRVADADAVLFDPALSAVTGIKDEFLAGWKRSAHGSLIKSWGSGRLVVYLNASKKFCWLIAEGAQVLRHSRKPHHEYESGAMTGLALELDWMKPPPPAPAYGEMVPAMDDR